MHGHVHVHVHTCMYMYVCILSQYFEVIVCTLLSLCNIRDVKQKLLSTVLYV